MAQVEVTPVRHAADLKAFIDLPWTIYQGEPNWVPPLKSSVKHLLDTGRHPYWRFAEQALLLARRNGRTIGRIAGIIDHNLNRFHGTGSGIWGFFECIDDQEAADALFHAVEHWSREKGMTCVRGPLNPSTNYEVGLLIEGYEHRATFMMPFNHPYYADLIERAGYRKEKDLLSLLVDDSCTMPRWMKQIADRLKAEGRFSIRTIDKRRLKQEMHLIKEVYDHSWARNWGFVPMTAGEFDEMGKELEKIADQDFIYFVNFDNRPVGVAVMVPDINPLLKRLNGKIGLVGLIKILLYKGDVNGLRGLLFGLKSRYRERGLPFFALDHLYTILYARKKYKYLELGWNLEDNEAINEVERDAGARFFKRYRVYRKNFADRW